MTTKQRVGRGLNNPFIYYEDLPFHNATMALHRIEFARVRGGKQRRGDFSQECMSLVKAVSLSGAFGGTDAIDGAIRFASASGRKTKRKLQRFANGYRILESSTNSIVKEIVSLLADGSYTRASYAFSNLSHTEEHSLLSGTNLALILAAKDGHAAERAWNPKAPWVGIGHMYRKNFSNAIKLLGLDALHTELALKALREQEVL